RLCCCVHRVICWSLYPIIRHSWPAALQATDDFWNSQKFFVLQFETNLPGLSKPHPGVALQRSHLKIAVCFSACLTVVLVHRKSLARNWARPTRKIERAEDPMLRCLQAR